MSNPNPPSELPGPDQSDVIYIHQLIRRLPYGTKHPLRLTWNFLRSGMMGIHAICCALIDMTVDVVTDKRPMNERIQTFGAKYRDRLRARIASPSSRLGRYLIAFCHVSRAAYQTAATRLIPRQIVPPRGKRILMLTISQIDHDPRINKVARSLGAAGYSVDIMCFRHDSVDEILVEQPFPGVRYVRVPFSRSGVGGINFWLLYQDGFRTAGLDWQFDYVHVNDLTTLWVGWILARRRNTALVYDAHEMWSENVSYSSKGWQPMSNHQRLLARWFEAFLIKGVDLHFSVSNSICDEFQRRYGLKRRPLLLANFPEKKLLDAVPANSKSLRDIVGATPNVFLTLYLGGVNPLRNIENVMRAHQFMPEDCWFVIRGPGIETYRPDYERLAAELGISHRVHFVEPVGRDDVLVGAIGADCGIVMLRNLCWNFYWFYPNKFFEYMLAGLPVAVSNFSDVSAHIERERCGVTFDPDSPKSIATALMKLVDDREGAREMGRLGREGILREYNWEDASQTLVRAYDELSTR